MEQLPRRRRRLGSEPIGVDQAATRRRSEKGRPAITLESRHNPILSRDPGQLSIKELAADAAAGAGRTRHDSKPIKRDYKAPERITHARDILDPLPRPGHQLHTIQTGQFPLCDLIPANRLRKRTG